MNKNYRRTRQNATAPVGVHGRGAARRGSALLIVIGTLALVAVFAAVYVSIGRTDRRTADATEAQLQQAQNASRVGEYLADVIGRDRLDSVVQYDINGEPFGRREVTDAPYTDWTRRTDVNMTSANERALLFTPTGGPYEQGSLNPNEDHRVASDPWLASTTPTYLGYPGDPAEGLDERPFSSFEAFNGAFPNSKNYLDRRDWLQISNFAPDGRPVNLFNLRPNAGFNDDERAGPFGGFDAEPGFGTSPRADGRQIRRMSNYLSLLKQQTPGDPESLIQAFDPAVEGVWVPGFNTPQDIGISGTELYNIPAVWTMYQRFMFMPINQPFITLHREGQVSTWADPDYPPYQYADADGDGFADSRWFELVAARNKSDGDNTSSAREDIESLYDRGEYRYFVAARAVDLSSMVNVNTATDQLAVPSVDYPVGLTPAEVDLRRLLTMQDHALDYTANLTPNGNAIALSLAAAHRPYIASDEPLYGPVDPANSAIFEQRNIIRNVADYWNYKHLYELSGSDPRYLSSRSTAMLVGRYAYAALRRAIQFGGSLSDEFKGYDLNYDTATLRTDLLQYEPDPLSTLPVPGLIKAEQRYEQYMRVGRLNPLSPSLSWATGTGGSGYGSGLFGIDDLGELLTYHGLNDPDFTSRLERVVDGRYESPQMGSNDDTLQTRRLGPLFSNRPLSLDRFQHGLALTNIGDNPLTPPNEDNPGYREVNGRVSINSMALMTLSPRKYLTTVSGFVPFSPDERFTEAGTAEALSALTLLPSLSDAVSTPLTLWGIYSGALAGEVDDLRTTTWTLDPDQWGDDSSSTLFYGHRGAELALRIAAHAAVNMADIADGDTDPTIATVILDSDQTLDLQQYAADISSGGLMDPENDPEYQLYPGVAQGNLFDRLGEDFNTGLPQKRQALNVYGLEATPVITEVSMLYVFTDAPGDPSDPNDDATPDLPPIVTVGSDTVLQHRDRDQVKQVTIDGTVDQSNKDYLLQVLAVQLHNPYDEAISLGGSMRGVGRLADGAPLTRQREYDDVDQIDLDSNYQFDYYIEYAGRFFKVAKYIEWYPTEDNLNESYFSLDDPATTPAYGTVPNPADSISPSTGGVMLPTSESGAYPDFITRNVVLQPGETRVFYAIADKRFDDPTGSLSGDNPDDRWEQYLRDWGQLPPLFEPSSIGVLPNADLDNDGLPDGGDGRGWTGPAEQWVQHQLTVYRSLGTDTAYTHSEPVMMMAFDPRDGSLLDRATGAFERLDQPTISPVLSDPSRVDLTEVRLWKKVVAEGEETSDSDSASPTLRNIVENDMLVDRMAVPLMGPGIFTSGETEIAGTWSYPEDFPENYSAYDGLFARNDNKGITVADWVTVRRADSEFEERPSVGQVTPWMLRARNNTSLTRAEHESQLRSLNAGDLRVEDIFDGTPDPSDPYTVVFAKGDYEISSNLRDFWDLSLTPGQNAIVQTIALPPFAKSNVSQPFGMMSPADNDVANRSAEKFPPHVLSVGRDLDFRDDNPVPEVFVGGGYNSDRPRLTDLLLPWGIGPTYAPDPTRSATVGVGFYDADEWMTASEAMAVALGVDTPVPSGPDYDEPDSAWVDAWDAADNEPYLLDDGHLAIDRFVPFINVVTEDPIEFTVGLDIPRGSGVPLALGVLDRARSIAPMGEVTDPLNPAGETLTRLNLSRPIFGAININTAPVEVLRLLPGLTPSRASYVAGPSGNPNEPEWWGANPLYEDLNLPDLSEDPGTVGGAIGMLRQNPDVAAAIVAYRDRIFGYPNTAAHPNRVDAGGGAYNYFAQDKNRALFFSVNDDPQNISSVAENFLSEDPVNFPASAFRNSMDRRTFTGIDGLRLTPGFSSIGELLAVQLDPEYGPYGSTPDIDRWNYLSHLSIQQLGYDQVAQGIVDGPEGKMTFVPQVFSGDSVGGTTDDYAERLALASGVMNMISVRSDFYAVWFVVQGYKESDVQNLRPQDPLVPSLHKRYLMVVDRTNVIEPGDKPRIVLLKEVPL